MTLCAECSPEQRAQFLRFATGRIALSNYDADGWLHVQVLHEWPPERLPEPHTCVPRMDMAPHVSQGQLSSKMRQVREEERELACDLCCCCIAITVMISIIV